MHENSLGLNLCLFKPNSFARLAAAFSTYLSFRCSVEVVSDDPFESGLRLLSLESPLLRGDRSLHDVGPSGSSGGRPVLANVSGFNGGGGGAVTLVGMLFSEPCRFAGLCKTMVSASGNASTPLAVSSLGATSRPGAGWRLLPRFSGQSRRMCPSTPQLKHLLRIGQLLPFI